MLFHTFNDEVLDAPLSKGSLHILSLTTPYFMTSFYYNCSSTQQATNFNGIAAHIKQKTYDYRVLLIPTNEDENCNNSNNIKNMLILTSKKCCRYEF